MAHASNTMWRIKNQPSNSTSCSDNALRLLVFVTSKLYRGLQVTSSSSSMWGCVLKGCFERGKFGRATLHLKGIEDFNLEPTGGTCKHSDLNRLCPINLPGHCGEAPDAALCFLKSSETWFKGKITHRYLFDADSPIIITLNMTFNVRYTKYY